MKILLLMIVFLLIPLTVARVEYTPSTDTICNNGVCTKTLYSGIRNVEEDGKWKRVEDARSLKGKGFNIEFLEEDENYPLEVIDFNYSSITVKLKSKGVSLFNKDIPVRVWDKNETKAEQFEKDLKDGKKKSNGVKDYKTKMDKVVEDKVNFNLFKQEEVKTLKFGLGKILDFGENSTTVILQEAGTENLEDTYITADGTTDNGEATVFSIGMSFGKKREAIIKFNFSFYGEIGEILESKLYLTSYSSQSVATGNSNIYYLDNQTWSENEFMNFTNYEKLLINGTVLDTINIDSTSGLKVYNVINGTKFAKNNYRTNLSFLINDSVLQNYNIHSFLSKESDTSSQRPYLNITYEEGGCTESIVNSSWSDWTNETECRVNNTLVQERNLTEYDENFCGEYENVTYYESQEAECVYEYFSFDNCRNYTVNLLSSFSRSMSASSHATIDTYFLNDTSAFNVNSEGLVTNATVLNELKTYSLNLSVNNSESSLISCIFKIEVTQGSTGSAPCLYTKLGFYNKELMKGLTLNHGGVNLC